jgi:hypothetical protein
MTNAKHRLHYKQGVSFTQQVSSVFLQKLKEEMNLRDVSEDELRGFGD